MNNIEIHHICVGTRHNKTLKTFENAGYGEKGRKNNSGE
jgi:hypothetical protein